MRRGPRRGEVGPTPTTELVFFAVLAAATLFSALGLRELARMKPFATSRPALVEATRPPR